MLRDFDSDPNLMDLARAWQQAPTTMPVAARASATVLLLRDSADGVEVFVLRRVASMAFAPRMHVFPGGGVDPRDADPELPWAGPSPVDWAAVLGGGAAEASELVCAAVRELFEECGVLLAARPGDDVAADLVTRSGSPTARRCSTARWR